MGWFSWFWDAFRATAFHIGVGKKKKVLLLGLDNAGKTTLLRALQSDKGCTPRPAYSPSVQEVVSIGGCSVTFTDITERSCPARRLRKDYIENERYDAIIFMVDANDPLRFAEAQQELHGILQEEKLQRVPALILGNKIDRPGAAAEGELRKALHLDGRVTGKGTPHNSHNHPVRPLEIFMCSVVCKAGYGSGFKWLVAHW